MKCAECQCSPLDCRILECSICTRDVCCYVPRKEHPIYRFFQTTIEVLCICAAEIGENFSFGIFGYKTAIGIT